MATGLSISTTSSLSDGQRIMIEQAMVAFEPAAPDPALISTRRTAQGVKQFDLSTYARLADSVQLTEGADVAQVQQLVTNSISITPAEHGSIATLSKLLVFRQDDSSVVAETGGLLGIAVRARQAKDVIALYDSFTKSTPGASSGLDVTHFRGTIAYLLTDNNTAFGPAPMPLKAALHIEQISDIIEDISDPGAPTDRSGLSAEMLVRWWRGRDRLYGIPIFHSGYIAVDSNSDSKGAIFAEAAMFMANAGDVDPTEEMDNSLRVIEYGIFQVWGEAQRADVHGVEIFSDTANTIGS